MLLVLQSDSQCAPSPFLLHTLWNAWNMIWVQNRLTLELGTIEDQRNRPPLPSQWLSQPPDQKFNQEKDLKQTGRASKDAFLKISHTIAQRNWDFRTILQQFLFRVWTAGRLRRFVAAACACAADLQDIDSTCLEVLSFSSSLWISDAAAASVHWTVWKSDQLLV